MNSLLPTEPLSNIFNIFYYITNDEETDYIKTCKHFKEQSDDYKMDKKNDGEKVTDAVGFCKYLYFLLIYFIQLLERITII